MNNGRIVQALPPSGTGLRVRVAPMRIEYCFQRRSPLSRLAFACAAMPPDGRLRRGRWDLRVFPFRDHETHVLMRTMLANDFAPDACHQALVEYYRRRGHGDGAAPKAARKLENYIRQYSAVARDMRENGYRPDLARDEIGLAIGRDGRLIKTSGGNHRLALAMLLDLPSVVADLRFAHASRYAPRTWFSRRRLDEALLADGLNLGLEPVEP